MSYAIIRLGGKQYRVREGERLRVDRLKTDEGKTFQPDLLFSPDGDGNVAVTARVVGHVRGEKIRIGKYRRRTGYKRHTGFRAALTEIEIESIGKGRAAAKKADAPKAEKPKAETPAPVAAPTVAAEGTAALPEGYADMTVAQVKEAAPGWSREQLEAALAYEAGHAKRKGATAALESAMKEDES